MSFKKPDQHSESYHLNPSRRKIPYPVCRRGFPFGQGREASNSARHNLNLTSMSQLIGSPTNQSMLSGILQDTSLQQHQHLLDQNRYLRKQLKQLKSTNKTLQTRLQDKQNDLVAADSEYRQLTLQVSNQLDKANSNIKSFIIDESKITHKAVNVSTIRDSTSNFSNVTRSDASGQRSRSKENLLRLKQIFEEMDFKTVEKLAKTKKTAE